MKTSTRWRTSSTVRPGSTRSSAASRRQPNTVSQFNPGVMSRLVDIMNNMGYKYFDWNVDSDDAGHTKTTNGIYTNVTEGRLRGGGLRLLPLVLQHDVKDYSVAADREHNQLGLNNGYPSPPLI